MTEDQLEAAITEYLALVLPPDCVAFHIPNGTDCKPTQTAKLKRAGMKTGMPDRGIVYKGRIYFLEAKRPQIKGVQKGGRLSHDQILTMQQLQDAGAKSVVVRSLHDVEMALKTWGIPFFKSQP